MVFEWDDSYTVGMPESDVEHRRLVDTVNRVFEMLDQGTVKGIFSVLGDLQHYLTVHFAREKALMEEFQYPGIEAHMAAHATFVRKVEFFLVYGGEHPVMVLKLAVFLQTWLQEHILTGEDRKLYEFLGTLPVRA